MVETVRTLADLLNVFRDGQAANSINEADLRDLIVSTVGVTGWADYVDTEHSQGSPQLITAATPTVLTNNGGTTQVQELPFDRSNGLFDPVSNTIVGNAGDSLMITGEFIINRQTGTQEYDIGIGINIGGGIPLLYERSFRLRGTEPRSITFTTGAYTLDTWQANGGEFILESNVDAEVYGKRVVVHRIHKGRGTYGA